MASVNKVILVGRLGKAPESRFTASGTAVCSFSLATSETFKDKAGEKQQKTEWHNIQLWAKLAEIAGQYLDKGSLIYLEGRLQTRKWQDRDGNDRYTTEIVGERLQMLDSKGDRSDSGAPANSTGTAAGSAAYEEPSFSDDDIPF